MSRSPRSRPEVPERYLALLRTLAETGMSDRGGDGASGEEPERGASVRSRTPREVGGVKVTGTPKTEGSGSRTSHSSPRLRPDPVLAPEPVREQVRP